jgi:hypothetical protein
MAFFLPATALVQAAQQDSNQDQRILREVRQILANEHAFDGMSIFFKRSSWNRNPGRNCQQPGSKGACIH